MCFVVLETVQILVAFLTDVTLVRLLLFHPHRAGVGGVVVGIDDRICAVAILVQSLVLVSVLVSC